MANKREINFVARTEHRKNYVLNVATRWGTNKVIKNSSALAFYSLHILALQAIELFISGAAWFLEVFQGISGDPRRSIYLLDFPWMNVWYLIKNLFIFHEISCNFKLDKQNLSSNRLHTDQFELPKGSALWHLIKITLNRRKYASKKHLTNKALFEIISCVGSKLWMRVRHNWFIVKLINHFRNLNGWLQ